MPLNADSNESDANERLDMTITKYSRTLRYFKEALLALCFLLSLPDIGARFADIDGVAGQASYLVLLAILWGALLTAAYAPSVPLRWSIAFLLSISAYYLTTFAHITAQFMTYDAFINMMKSAGFIEDALAQNRPAFIKTAGPALLLLTAIGLKPERRLPLMPGWLVSIGPWMGVALLAGVLFARGGDGARGQPPGFAALAYLGLAGYESATGHIGPRQPVTLPQASGSLTRNIVFIIDESIAGRYLDINSAAGVPTPLSQAWTGIDIHNYGLAASITNCSVGSNLTLRYGGTRADYQRINATWPSIWAYARKAGMRTVYIDGQRTGGALQNGMTSSERAQIDSFMQFDDIPVQQRDIAIAHQLVRELVDPKPKLILVNKVGAHFPVHDKYPDGYLRYRPALHRGQYRDISDTGERFNFGGTPEDWVRYRNSYRNTLLWNVGAFFKIVLEQADLSQTTLIYTGDHGQNLHEHDNPGVNTHCSPDPIREEGVVPLLVIEGKGASRIDWTKNLARNHGQTSHYMIFPTLLALMGYDTVSIQSQYGQSLDQPSNDPGTFNTLFNARLNRQPRWLAIEPTRAEPLLTSDTGPAMLGEDRQPVQPMTRSH